MRDLHEKPKRMRDPHVESMLLRDKRCQSCGRGTRLGELQCQLCNPMQFAGYTSSLQEGAKEILKVAVFRLARVEPASSERRHPSIPERLIRVALATAVVAALFVAGMNLL